MRDDQARRPGVARHLETLVDFATGSHPRAILVLFTVALFSFLPGFFTIPTVDRDEARFAQATKQMVESGNYIDIRFQDETRYKKPVGIYWLQAVAVRTAGRVGVSHALTTIWLYRLPSLAGALGAVGLTYWAALALVSRRAAVLAGLMMASCLLLGVESRLATTDAMLLLTTVAAMGGLARVYLSIDDQQPDVRTWWTPAIVWTALAAGVLLKGPAIVLVVGLSVATLVIADRSIRWLARLRPVSGLLWFAALVLPWFVAILALSGGRFMDESARDIFPKILSGQEGHGAPPGFHLALFWATFWPGATLAGLAVPGIFAARREPASRFLLAWLIPSWIVFELVATKLAHYVLPLYPAAAILIAGIVDARALSCRPSLVKATIWWFVCPLLLGLLSIATLVVTNRQMGLLAWPLVGAAVVTSFVGWRSYDADHAERTLLCGVAAAILLWGAVFGVVAPAMQRLFPSATLAGVMQASGCEQPLAVTTLTYQEPSLVFLTGTDTRATDAMGAVEFLRGGPCRFAFVDASEAERFTRRADAVGLRYRSDLRVDAINFSNTSTIAIAVYRSE